MTQDDQRANFLLALDRSEVELHGFELDFVSSNLDRFNFSGKQRVILDKLIAKYSEPIKWNPGRNLVAERAAQEQKEWDKNPARYMAQAHKKMRRTERVKELLKRRASDRKFCLDHHPIVQRSVMRFGVRMEDHWVDYLTGILKAPYLCEEDEIEYEFFSG